MSRKPFGSRLYYASWVGLQDMSLALLEAGADPNTKGRNGDTVLQVASQEGQYRTVQCLLEKGADVNMKGGWFGSALHSAAARNHEEIVRLLLENGADVDMEGGDYNTALQAAASGGHRRRKRQKFFIWEEQDVQHGNGLPAVSEGSHANILRLLLEKGDVDIARNLNPQELEAVAKNPEIKVENGPKGTVYYLGLNQKNPNLAKPEVRQAMKWLVDYSAIADTIMKNKGEVHQAFLPKGFLGAVNDNPYKLDVSKAKELLANPAGEEQVVGNHPDTGLQIVAKNGRFGPYVTEVLPEDAPKSAKPRTGSLFKSMTLDTVSIEEAVKLLDLPRVVGTD